MGAHAFTFTFPRIDFRAPAPLRVDTPVGPTYPRAKTLRLKPWIGPSMTTNGWLDAWTRAVDHDMAALPEESMYAPEFVDPTAVARAAARALLLRLALSSKERSGALLPLPSIEPAADGGVDIHWTTDRCELLVGVPSTSGVAVTFYGDTPAGAVIKGAFSQDDTPDFLIAWLLERA